MSKTFKVGDRVYHAERKGDKGTVVRIVPGIALIYHVQWDSIPDRTMLHSSHYLNLCADNPVTSSKDSPSTSLPVASELRKEHPVYSGIIKYFPAALAGVARVSKIGNDKHNPGEPLHHARGKSSDHADCIIRHLIDLCEDYGKGVGRDEHGMAQVSYIAWRALALAQEWHEKYDEAPLAPGAKLPEEVE